MAFDLMDEPGEVWKRSLSAPQLEVSNLGRVRAEIRPGGGKIIVRRVLKGERLQNGYRGIRAVRGESKRYLVHRLVCEAFRGAPTFPDATVDHLDGDRANNRVENLEWVTRSENTRRQNAAGRAAPKGELHPLAKLSNFQAAAVPRLRAAGWAVSEIAQLFSVSDSLIYGIVRGQRRSTAP